MRAQLASQRAALDAERARTVRLVNKALSPRQCAPNPLFLLLRYTETAETGLQERRWPNGLTSSQRRAADAPPLVSPKPGDRHGGRLLVIVLRIVGEGGGRGDGRDPVGRGADGGDGRRAGAGAAAAAGAGAGAGAAAGG